MIKPEDLIPVKTVSDLMADTISRLKDLAFKVTNLRPGGVFYTLLELGNQALADIYELFQTTLPQLYLDTATEEWLDLKAAEYGVIRKPAVSTRGHVTFIRDGIEGNLIIPIGTEVMTPVDANDNRLKFMVIEQGGIPAGESAGTALVEAEFPGSEYNVGPHMITELLTLVGGVVAVDNEAGWITREGCDEEGDEELRARAKGVWSSLATGGTAASYETWAKEIPGVLVVWVDNQHPRGQGTIDLYVSSTAGVPTQDLLDRVAAHIETRRPLCADVVVLGPEFQPVDFDVTLTINSGDPEMIRASALDIINDMFAYGDKPNPAIKRAEIGLGLTQAQVISNLMTIDGVINTKVRSPEDNYINGKQLLVMGAVNIIIEVLS